MKRMKMLLPLMLILALLGSCGQTAENEVVSGSSVVSEESSSAVSAENDASEEADAPGGEQEIIDHPTGDSDGCSVHTASYHAVPLHLIMAVGSEEYNAWTESAADEEMVNIAQFVEHFQIPRADLEEMTASRVTEERLSDFDMTKEEYLAAYGYTDAQIEAIYSGDAAAVESAFAAE